MKQNRYLRKTKTVLQSLFLLIALPVVALSDVAFVAANHLNEQIHELNQENAQFRATQAELADEAQTLEGKITQLQSEINGLQSQINENEAKSAAVQKEIDAAEIELARQKELLGKNIKIMYLEGDISTFEMLATSKDLSDYLDKQQYRKTIQAKIKTTLDKVTELKVQLDTQKAQLTQLIADQKGMQSQLDAQRSEQNRLLNLNEAQRSAVNGEILANNAELANLRRQQALENATVFGSVGTGVNCGGGYPGSARGPWGNWGCNFAISNTIDNWGMYNRQCVSYTAYKVAASGRYMPYWGGRGNARNWDDNARAMGIAVDSNPRAGDVGVSHYGYYGHVFYVEFVGNDGSIYVSDYNNQWDGRYREYWISASAIRNRGLVFVHF